MNAYEPRFLTRRQVLVNTAGLASVAMSGGAVLAGSALDRLVERAVIVFPNYSAWVSAYPNRSRGLASSKANVSPDTVVISDANPSVFADLGCIALIRPALLRLLPAADLVNLVRRKGALVASYHSGLAQGTDAKPDGRVSWERLAEMLWLLGPLPDVLVDLNGAVSDVGTVRDCMDTVRNAYARYSKGEIAIRCRCEPPA